MKMTEIKIKYKKNEFCKDVGCIFFYKNKCIKNPPECCCKTAKEFHKWLKKNDFEIVKK